MVKPITTKWQDALDMVSECKVVRKPQLVGTELLFLMEDPVGQKFLLQVRSKAIPGLSGNILTLAAGFEVIALELEAGDRYGDLVF